MFRSYAIVPAAGRATRMGAGKLLLPWKGSTVIAHVLAAWRQSTVTHTVVVVHPHDRTLANVVRATGAVVVRAIAPPADMKASVRIGLQHVSDHFRPSGADVWLVAPADMPGLAPSIIDRLLAAHSPGSPRIVVPVHAGRRGHPALFPWNLAAEVANLAADGGVDQLLEHHPVERLVCTAEAVPVDLDTQEDYSDRHRR